MYVFYILSIMDNRVILKSSIFIFGILFCIPHTLVGGAWTRQKNEVYSSISYSQFISNEIFTPKGNKKIPGPDFTDNSLNYYLEYGHSKTLTGILLISYKDIKSTQGDSVQKETGISDIWVNIKKRVYDGPVIVSAQVGMKLPVGYDEKNIPPLGEGQIDTDYRMLAGKSLYPFPLYLSGEIGYRKRNGDWSDEVIYVMETGGNISQRILVKVTYEKTDNRTNDTASTAPLGTTMAFDKEHEKISSSIIIQIHDNYHVDVGYSTLISGSNESTGETFFLGVAYKGSLGK